MSHYTEISCINESCTVSLKHYKCYRLTELGRNIRFTWPSLAEIYDSLGFLSYNSFSNMVTG